MVLRHLVFTIEGSSDIATWHLLVLNLLRCHLLHQGPSRMLFPLALVVYSVLQLLSYLDSPSLSSLLFYIENIPSHCTCTHKNSDQAFHICSRSVLLCIVWSASFWNFYTTLLCWCHQTFCHCVRTLKIPQTSFSLKFQFSTDLFPLSRLYIPSYLNDCFRVVSSFTVGLQSTSFTKLGTSFIYSVKATTYSLKLIFPFFRFRNSLLISKRSFP